MLLRGDSEMALGHGDFLRGMEKFMALPTREQRRTLENNIFWVSSNCTLSSCIHITQLKFFLQNIVFIVELLGSQQVALKERANIDLLKRVDALSAEKKKADERLVKLRADLDRELVTQRSRQGKLERLRKEFQVMESVLQKELPTLQKS